MERNLRRAGRVPPRDDRETSSVRLVLLLALPAWGWCAEVPPPKCLDAVLVLQDSPGLDTYRYATDPRAFHPCDRVALVTFSAKPHLRFRLTGDSARVAAALRRPRRFPAGRPWPESQPKIRVFDALTYASGLFPGKPDPSRQRAVVVLFADEDQSSGSTIEDVRRGLRQAEAVLGVAAVAREEQRSPTEMTAQTPPTLPGPQNQVVRARHRPLPETTFEALRLLSADTQGAAQKGEWNLGKMLQAIRDRR